MIEDISRKFDQGLISFEDVEALLMEALGDDEAAKAERRSRVIKDDKIVKFQLIGLNKQAQEASLNHRVQEARAPDVEPALLDDVPDFDGTENLGPDYVPDIKSKLGIIAGVRMFGKPQDTIRSNKSEGVKVRCPFEHHDDKRPSAWVNTDKNTWFCGKCQVGGDVIDFYAARKHNLAPHDFHRSAQFRTITEEMAGELGIEVYTPYDTSEWASPLPDEIEDDDEESDDDLVTDEEMARIEPESRESDPPIPASSEATEPITISEDEILRGVAFDQEAGTVVLKTPTLNVDTLPIPEGTFLHTWLAEIRKGYPWVPEEYLLFLGLQAIGLAAGHYTVSNTAGLPLNGSLMISIVGPSGYGKSTAANFLRDLVQTSGPGPKFDPATGTGVKEVQTPASAEALLRGAKTEIDDPGNVTGPRIEVPTTGWMFEDELATFVSRARRAGGGHLKQYLMKFHDFTKRRDAPEPVFDDLALTTGPRRVHDTFFSATFLTQTQALRTLADNEDLVSGFMNRIIPVFGHQQEPQHPFKEYTVVPSPYYKTRYEDLWKVCRPKGVTMGSPNMLIPAPDCEKFFNQHPFFSKAQRMINEHSIYARLIHITLRLALLFAINEHARDCNYNKTPIDGKELEVKHLAIAVDVVERLVVPGFTAIMDAVSASEVADYMDQFMDYIRNYLDKHEKHPMKSRLAAAAFNKRFDVSSRRQALDYLIKSGQVVEFTLAKARTKSVHYAVAEGKWRGLHHHNTYKEEEIYGNK